MQPFDSSRQTSWIERALVFSIFLVILGFKLLLIAEFGKPHPYWDAWYVEGECLYKPLLEHTYRLADLLTPINEHRSVCTKISHAAWLFVNGQWDGRLQMAWGAVLFALLGPLLFYTLGDGLKSAHRFALGAAVALCLALPTGFENTLSGHQVMFFYFYLFSIAGMWFAVTQEPLSRKWYFGIVFIIASYFSLFSAILTAAAATIGMVYTALQRRARGSKWTGIALLPGLIALAFYLQPFLPGEAVVRASSTGAFLKSFYYAIAWPHFELTVLAAVGYIPWIVLGVVSLWRPAPLLRGVTMSWVLGLWVLIQCAAMAYARGQSGVPPVVRYFDILSFGVLANFACLLAIGTLLKPRRVWLGIYAAFAGLWVWGCETGLETRMTYSHNISLPQRARLFSRQEINLRGFVATGDPAVVDSKNSDEVAYWGGALEMKRYLSDETIRGILPSSIAPPVPVAWQSRPADVFVAGGLPPETPKLAEPGVLGSYHAEPATGVLKSELLYPGRRPYLEFWVAGAKAVNSPGNLELSLVPESGAAAERVRLPELLPDEWQPVHVQVPSTPFRIVAVDTDPSGWFAFTAPRSMAALSVFAERAVASGSMVRRLGFFSLAVSAALGLLMFLARRGPTRSIRS